MTPLWLPYEFDGPRAPHDAISDLRTIAAGGLRSEAHVVFHPASGESTGGSGPLSIDPDAGTDAVIVSVAGKPVVRIDPREIQSSHLVTYDEADYYSFVIETAAGTLRLFDAYND